MTKALILMSVMNQMEERLIGKKAKGRVRVKSNVLLPHNVDGTDYILLTDDHLKASYTIQLNSFQSFNYHRKQNHCHFALYVDPILDTRLMI